VEAHEATLQIRKRSADGWTICMYVCMYVFMYIGFKTSFYVVRLLDSIASYLSTGLHLGFFRSWPSLYLPSIFFFRSSSCYLMFRHTLRKPSGDRARQALEWNSQGQRGRGRPLNTWRRKVLEEAKTVKKTWMEIKPHAKNRVRWRILVEALCWGDVIHTHTHI